MKSRLVVGVVLEAIYVCDFFVAVFLSSRTLVVDWLGYCDMCLFSASDIAFDDKNEKFLSKFCYN